MSLFELLVSLKIFNWINSKEQVKSFKYRLEKKMLKRFNGAEWSIQMKLVASAGKKKDAAKCR